MWEFLFTENNVIQCFDIAAKKANALRSCTDRGRMEQTSLAILQLDHYGHILVLHFKRDDKKLGFIEKDDQNGSLEAIFSEELLKN